MKAATRAALSDEGVDTTMVSRDRIFDGAADLAITKASAAVERGRLLRPHETAALRRQELARQAGEQPPGQPRAQRPRLRDRLEAMTEVERRAAVESVTPGTRERRYVEHLVESIEQIDFEAELLAAQQTEDAWLAEHEDDEEPEPQSEWSPGLTPAEMRAAEHDAAIGDPWGSAQATLAAETGGPLYTGDPSELEDEYEYEEADE